MFYSSQMNRQSPPKISISILSASISPYIFYTDNLYGKMWSIPILVFNPAFIESLFSFIHEDTFRYITIAVPLLHFIIYPVQKFRTSQTHTVQLPEQRRRKNYFQDRVLKRILSVDLRDQRANPGSLTHRRTPCRSLACFEVSTSVKKPTSDTKTTFFYRESATMKLAMIFLPTKHYAIGTLVRGYGLQEFF